MESHNHTPLRGRQSSLVQASTPQFLHTESNQKLET